MGPEGVKAKYDVIRGHCDTVGRDFAEIEKTVLTRFAIGNGGGSHPSGMPLESVDQIVERLGALAAIGTDTAIAGHRQQHRRRGIRPAGRGGAAGGGNHPRRPLTIRRPNRTPGRSTGSARRGLQLEGVPLDLRLGLLLRQPKADGPVEHREGEPDDDDEVDPAGQHLTCGLPGGPRAVRWNRWTRTGRGSR